MGALKKFGCAGVLLALVLSLAPAWAETANSLSSWTEKKAGLTVDLSKFQTIPGGAAAPALREKTVLVHVWATWCAPCVTELPAFDALAKRLTDKGIPVVALSVDRGGLSEVKPFMTKHPSFAHSTVLLDPSYQSGELWGIRILPTTLLIKDGREVARLIGKGDWEGDEGEELAALLAR